MYINKYKKTIRNTSVLNDTEQEHLRRKIQTIQV